GSVKSLADLGISSNGNDNKLEIAGTKLDAAISGSLPALQTIFTDSEKGVGTQLDKYLESMVGDEGSLIKKQDNLTKAAAKIDTDIADLERIVQANRDAMILSFVAMEKAQASMNQQLTYLQRIGGQT
ncbi:MAG: flagellar filament capping protein FliD, partial [Chloroflexia bacterium]|nr:flagellar filament capping protein FliD [Chloroflexia bacterium]